LPRGSKGSEVMALPHPEHDQLPVCFGLAGAAPIDGASVLGADASRPSIPAKASSSGGASVATPASVGMSGTSVAVVVPGAGAAVAALS